MNTKKILMTTAVLYWSFMQAQQSQFFSDKEKYREGLAENLFQTKIYNASQYEYSRQYFYNNQLTASQKEAAQFYDNVIGVILKKNHAEEGLEAFIKKYPHSAYFAKANLPLADYYLAQKDFDKALETLEKVHSNQLSKEEKTEYALKLGYARFMSGDTQGAIESLQGIYDQLDENERGDVAYILGHLYYSDGQNDRAFIFFDSIKDSENFAYLVKPYYLQRYFNDKEYDKAIEEGNELLTYKVSDEYKAEVHKIIGECYFMKEDYSAAYPHLKAYLGTLTNPSENDLYEIGFAASKLKNYDEAVFYYSQLINSQSELSQNAYYQLGNAYLQTGKKQEALSAFRSAYQMKYDAHVKQLAHEQYAKLSYEIGNPFEGAPTVIQNYILHYPNSPSAPEIKSLLVKSHLHSGNYKETLDAIDKLQNSTPETDKVDQEVSFLLGTEEFNKGNYDEAERYLTRSLETNQNPSITPRATYWLAQTYYNKGNYPSAIVRYERVLGDSFPEKQQLPYDLGYAYYKSKKFTQAQKYFQMYLENPKPEFKDDAALRLADTYYAENQLNEAIAIYDKTTTSTDYTLFQKAMSLGFKGDTQAKISNLKQLLTQYPQSDYVDDAQYEIATAYAAQEDYTNSNAYFSKVIKESSNKDLVANARIYLAQNFIEQNQEDKALAEFKKLGEAYKNTAYASKIVQASRPLFLKKNDLSGYQAFAQSLGVKVDASEINEINLTTARNYFAKKDYQKAIPYYEKYLTQQPTGEGLYSAQYELGEGYYQIGSQNKAVLVLKEVAEVQNDFQEEAQTRLVQIYLKQNKTSEAKTYLTRLAQSSNANIKNFANIELIPLYANEKNFSQAEKMADLVLANSKNSAAVRENAKVIKARSLMNSGKDKDAQKAYLALEKSSNTAVAAEALYAKSFYQNKAKAYKSSNETIFKLANNYATEEYWGGKALLVMTRNYLGLKDKYQASYTIDQVISNYQDFSDIIAEAKSIKKRIK